MQQKTKEGDVKFALLITLVDQKENGQTAMPFISSDKGVLKSLKLHRLVATELSLYAGLGRPNEIGFAWTDEEGGIWFDDQTPTSTVGRSDVFMKVADGLTDSHNMRRYTDCVVKFENYITNVQRTIDRNPLRPIVRKYNLEPLKDVINQALALFEQEVADYKVEYKALPTPLWSVSEGWAYYVVPK